MQPIANRVSRRIRSSGDGCVFSPTQFLDLGGRSAVGVALHRLVKAGTIRRILRGLHDLPRAHPITGQTAPNTMATVRALMDGSHAQWQFTGAYAANALGLSDQVPSKIIILTDGVPRRVSLGKLTLVFRRAAPRNLLGTGQRAGLVIQALRYLHTSPELSRHVARLKKLWMRTRSVIWRRSRPSCPRGCVRSRRKSAKNRSGIPFYNSHQNSASNFSRARR